jgi:hypothetical protein
VAVPGLRNLRVGRGRRAGGRLPQRGRRSLDPPRGAPPGESNRSRWDTDPTWCVVQRAPFDPTPLPARRLVRQQQRRHAIEQIDQQLLGLFKTREALMHADPTERDVSVALRDELRALERELQRRGEDFGAAARLRRRDRGLPVPTAVKVLPLRPRRDDPALMAERARLRELEEELDAWHLSQTFGPTSQPCEGPKRLKRLEREGTRVQTRDADEGRRRGGPKESEQSQPPGRGSRVRERAWLQWRSAETRMHQVFAALEEVEASGGTLREQERLVARFERSVNAYGAAERLLRRVDSTAGAGKSLAESRAAP